jgi:hypothetical protein
MEAARQRFDKDIKEEILRRLQDARTSWITMSRDEIIEIGITAGLHKLRAIGEFERLAGAVWAGHLHPRKGSPFWFDSPPKEPIPRWITVDFPRWWFERRGMLP